MAAPEPGADGGAARVYQLRVVRIPGESCLVPASGTDTAGDIRRRLGAGASAECGDPPEERERVVFEGRPLADGQSLLSCGVLGSERPTLYLVPAGARLGDRPSAPGAPGGFRGVRVSTLSGEPPLLLEAEPCLTADGLKARLEERLGVPAGQQRLLHEGAELSGHRTLASQGVPTLPAATVYLLLGGAVAEEGAATAGSLVERRLDGVWFRARVLRCRSVQGQPLALDLLYLDDGKTESGVCLGDDVRPVLPVSPLAAEAGGQPPEGPGRC